MSAAQRGKRPRPPAKASGAKPKAAAKPKAGARPRPKTRPKGRRKKKAGPSLWARLGGLSRLTWLAGLCLAIAGVVLAWWWASPPAPGGPGPLPTAATAPVPRSAAPGPRPQPPAPPAQTAPSAPKTVAPVPMPPVPPQPPAPAPPRPMAPPATLPSTSTTSTTTTSSTTTTTSSTAAPPAQRRQTLPMPEPPPFEEPQADDSASQARLQALDEALFAALRQGGLEPAQIRIQVNGGPQGEVTLLEARLRPGQDQKAVARALDQGLRRAQARGTWQPQAGGQMLSVSLGQELTHRVSLLTTPAPKAPPPEPPTPLPPGARPRVAIVIDDMGYQVEQARRLLALDLRLTLSILPFAPQARETAELARSQGALVMVHLPMEPRTYPALKPGPGGLLVSMDPEALRQATRQALRQVPGAAGANNHMGSRLTEEPAALQPVLEALRQEGLFFLDSVTSPRSQARDLARRMGLAHGQRDVFLDHDPTAAAITQQVHRLLKLAKAQGRAIAIGHPHASTIAVLTSLAPRLKQEVELVPVSQLLTPAGQGELDSQAARP